MPVGSLRSMASMRVVTGSVLTGSPFGRGRRGRRPDGCHVRGPASSDRQRRRQAPVDPPGARADNGPVLTARLFGGLAVEVDGRRVAPPPGRRPRAVLAYLLHLPGLHHRSRLAGTFWPDFPQASAPASL